jgi:DNA-binding FadR family transcriptional regulator
MKQAGARSRRISPAVRTKQDTRKFLALFDDLEPMGSRVHTRIAHRIGIAILNDEFPPGFLLPSEIEASEAFAVSRGAYREAMRVLTAKGMVRSRTKTGTRVTPRRCWAMLDPDVLSWIFEGEPSETFIDSLFELRSIVEPTAAALAAQRRSSMQLAKMANALEVMAEQGLSTEEGRSADRVFHEEIFKASGNELLTTLTATVGAAIELTTTLKHRRCLSPRDALREHRKLFDAIARGDAGHALQEAEVLIRLALEDTRVMLAR